MQDNGFENDEDKYHVIERKNLIQLLKLSVKNFIDHALSITSGLDEEDPTLYQFFVVIEKVKYYNNFFINLLIELINKCIN